MNKNTPSNIEIVRLPLVVPNREQIIDQVYGFDSVLWKRSELYSDRSEYEKILFYPGSVVMLAKAGDDIVGYSSGTPIGEVRESFGDQLKEPWAHAELIDDDSVYATCTSVRLDMQGQGIGTRLFESRLEEARKEGFKNLVGHFRAAGEHNSYNMMKRYDPEIEIPCEEYADGELYMFCKKLL